MFRKQVIVSLIATILGTSFIVGCGPSQHDLMMKAARRQRPKDPNEVAAEKKPPPKKKKKPASPGNFPPPPSARAARAKKQETPKKDEGPKTVSKKALTVDELREKSKLSGAAKRQWAADNIAAIGEAIEKYYKKNGYYFRRYHKNRSGFDTLSWRVKLLPYLGYNDLYKKFDFEKPWYMEPNKSLLKFIPKEFVSPERFDTRTNFQLSANRLGYFPNNNAQRKSKVEDGPENTIMLLEVNDDWAVEWTAPEDFTADLNNLSQYLHGVRKEGTFALWGNGWPVLLSKKVSDSDLKCAFTAESGDKIVAGKIHRPLPTSAISSGSVAAKPSATPTKVVKKVEEAPVGPIAEVQIKRDPPPVEGDIEDAMNRLRRAFEAKIDLARTVEQRRSLASELLGMGRQLKNKPDEAYALMMAAERLATGSGDASLMISALDSRIGRFEVDAYQENLTALSNFAEQSMNPRLINGRDEYIRRGIHVMYAAVSENDFLRANKIARSTGRYASQGSVTALPRMFTKLQSYLGAAQASYNDAKEHLTSLRINPEDDVAAAEFGQFLCFIKGDWTTGLPLLVRSTNDDLAAVAKMELEGAKSIDEKVALADTWTELASRASGVYRQAAVNRAMLHYGEAYKNMPQGLDKMHVKNQLDSVKATDPTGPVALIELIAKAMSVDLKVSLLSLAATDQSGQVKKKRFDDDDD